MEQPSIFAARELCQRSDELLAVAEQGRLSVIANERVPVIVAVPFGQRLRDIGIHRTLALNLFEAGQLSLARAAKMAALSQEEFMGLLREAGIPAVDYSSDELAGEVDVAR